MATLVAFHAHPDDESISTAGLMARAAAVGHRVVLVVATRGEHGEVVPGVLANGEQLGIRRVAETMEAARILGVDRVEFLGYVDSGMMGDPENAAPYSFWSADVEAAANRLATILQEEAAEVLTVYDSHGGYGHPDHIQVHRVGVRAAQIAGTPFVYEATMNRDALARLRTAAAEDQAATTAAAADSETAQRAAEPEFGTSEKLITHAVEIHDQLGRKRQAMAAHASQISPDSFFLAMPAEAFAGAFGTEWFIHHGVPASDGPSFFHLLPGLV